MTEVSVNYTEDEEALNTFQKLHPLLSLESIAEHCSSSQTCWT